MLCASSSGWTGKSSNGLRRNAARIAQAKQTQRGPRVIAAPLRPITLELGITAARARSAQHTREFLESLPVENPDTF